jgi:hypothetical protein
MVGEAHSPQDQPNTTEKPKNEARQETTNTSAAVRRSGQPGNLSPNHKHMSDGKAKRLKYKKENRR